MLTAVLHYDSGVNRHGSDARANSASSISSIHARERLVVGLGAERAEHRPDHRGCGRRGVFRVAEKARRLLRGGVESKQLVATFVRIARRRSVVPDPHEAKMLLDLDDTRAVPTPMVTVPELQLFKCQVPVSRTNHGLRRSSAAALRGKGRLDCKPNGVSVA